ncbi:universal stress protein [Yinghuangia aomiensis]
MRKGPSWSVSTRCSPRPGSSTSPSPKQRSIPAARCASCTAGAPRAWSPDGAGPVFSAADVQAAAERGLAEATAGRAADYPHVRVSRELLPESAAGALVHASATAGLTVVGRRVKGTALGLRLGPVAHAVLLHAHGPVAVVPYGQERPTRGGVDRVCASRRASPRRLAAGVGSHPTYTVSGFCGCPSRAGDSHVRAQAFPCTVREHCG